MILWEIIVAGAIGGLARACYSALKFAENRQRISPWYFLISIITAAFLGGVLGSIFNSGKALSALVGYIGSDILENIIKGVAPKSLSF